MDDLRRAIRGAAGLRLRLRNRKVEGPATAGQGVPTGSASPQVPEPSRFGILRQLSKDTRLLLVSWLLANAAFILLFFVPAYLLQAKSFGTVFPLGWDPPGYAGYAKVILSGDLLRPIVDQNSLGLANYLVALISGVTFTSPAVATIIFIHLTLAASSFLLAYLVKQYLADRLVILAAPWLVLFSGMALRLYTIPDQSLSLALATCFILLTVIQAGKETAGRRWYIYSTAVLVALFAAHWYYDLGVLTLVMALALAFMGGAQRRRMAKILLPPFAAAYVISLATISLTLEKVLVEWKVSEIVSPYSKPPTLATAIGYLNGYILNASVLVAVLFAAGLWELFIWSRRTYDPGALAFRAICRALAVTAIVVVAAGLSLSSTRYVERGFFAGLLIIPVILGASWARRGVNFLARRVKIRSAGFTAAVLFVIVTGSVVASSVPYLQTYRSTYDITYVTPSEFQLMQLGAATLANSTYVGTPTVMLYNPAPSYYDVFEYMKVAMMTMGDVSFQYGLLPNSTLDPSLSAYEQSLSTYLNYLEYQEISRGSETAGPFVLIEGLYNDPGNTLGLPSINGSNWTPLVHGSSWSVQTLPGGSSTVPATLSQDSSGTCGGMPLRLQVQRSNASQRVSAFEAFPNANLSAVDYLRFVFVGNGSGVTWQLRLSTTRWTSFYYVSVKDDFTGPRQLVFAKSAFAEHGSPSWSRIGSAEFIGQAQEGAWQFGCLQGIYNATAPKVVLVPNG